MKIIIFWQNKKKSSSSPQCVVVCYEVCFFIFWSTILRRRVSKHVGVNVSKVRHSLGSLDHDNELDDFTCVIFRLTSGQPLPISRPSQNTAEWKKIEKKKQNKNKWASCPSLASFPHECNTLSSHTYPTVSECQVSPWGQETTHLCCSKHINIKRTRMPVQIAGIPRRCGLPRKLKTQQEKKILWTPCY